MPDRPRNGGTFRLQSKATGKLLDAPEPPGILAPGGVWREGHIVPTNEGVVWELEDFVAPGSGYHFYRFTARTIWSWTTGTDLDTQLGRLDSNHQRQVYGHRPNDSYYQMWTPVALPDGYFRLTNRATGLALDGNYTDIYMSDVNTSDFQRWGFIATPPPPFPF